VGGLTNLIIFAQFVLHRRQALLKRDIIKNHKLEFIPLI
jgi:hypothetical protein